MPPESSDAGREAIATSPDATLIVEAAAGTGRPRAGGRIVTILAEGRAEVGETYVTFTKRPPE